VDGVSYPASPSTNTVPVVTGANTITYETVPNAALTNSSITLNAGTNVGLTAPGAMTLGNTYTFGATTDTPQFTRLGLGLAADANIPLSITMSSNAAIAKFNNTGSNDAQIQVFATASQKSYINFVDGTTSKYTVGKDTGNGFFIFDVANSKNFVTYSNSTQNFTIISPFFVNSLGPHAIGAGSANTNIMLDIKGAFSGGSTNDIHLGIEGGLTPAAGKPAMSMDIKEPITVAASGTHALLAGIKVEDTFVNGVGSVTDVAGIDIIALAAPNNTTNASGLKIEGAPTNATNMYSLWVAAGTTLIGTDPGGSDILRVGGALRTTAIGIGTASTSNSIDVQTSSAIINLQPSVTTSRTYVRFASGATTFVGAEDSTGSAFGFGSLGAYAVLLGSLSNVNLVLATNGTPRLSITGAGAATLSSTVFMSGLTTSTSTSLHSVCIDNSTFEILNDSNVCVVSASRFKNTIEDSLVGLEMVKQLRPVSYYLNDDAAQGQLFGFVAEEVEAIDSRFVTYTKNGQIYSVKYLEIIPVLVKAVQELEARVKELEAKDLK